MPSRLHAYVQSMLIAEFAKDADYQPFSELSLHLPGDKPRTPDICLYPRRVQDWLHDDTIITEPPALVVEIFSPSQTGQELMEKVQAYLATGVKSVWLVSPPMRSIALYYGQNPGITYGSGDIIDPVINVKISHSAVFA